MPRSDERAGKGDADSVSLSRSRSKIYSNSQILNAGWQPSLTHWEHLRGRPFADTGADHGDNPHEAIAPAVVPVDSNVSDEHAGKGKADSESASNPKVIRRLSNLF